MPWACFPVRWPVAVPPPQPAVHALPVPPVRHGIGHRARRHLRHWGLSHAGAAVAWRASVTCVWIAGGAAAGGVGWLAAPYLPGVAAGLLPGAGAVSPEVVVAVPAPGCALVLALAVGVLAWVRR